MNFVFSQGWDFSQFAHHPAPVGKQAAQVQSVRSSPFQAAFFQGLSVGNKVLPYRMSADRAYFQQFQKTRHVANVFGALLDNGDYFFFAHSLLLLTSSLVWRGSNILKGREDASC
jgi:hypothetical protein